MRFLITAGPTREYLDPVRFISNGSTGQMGYACAEAALHRGHKVVLISGPVSLQPPGARGLELIKVLTAEEMAQAVAEQFGKCDCLIMTAAVCDYKPLHTEKYKMQKAAGQLSLKLERTRDILAEAGQKKVAEQILVGFAVQDKAAKLNARRKMKSKNLDMVVLNSPAAFGSAKSEISILCKGSSWRAYRTMTKKASARIIIRQSEKLFRTGCL